MSKGRYKYCDDRKQVVQLYVSLNITTLCTNEHLPFVPSSVNLELFW